MFTDRQGNTVSGATAEAVDLFDQAVHAFNIYRGDPVGLLNEAAKKAPGFGMAHIGRAHLFATMTEPAAMQQSRAAIDQARSLSLNDREQSHVACLERLFREGWVEAAVALDRHNLQYPRDILALQTGHLMDFLRANARNLRDRVARVLPSWSPEIPGYSIVLGMQAFGLEECGDYARAEDVGRRAVAMQPLDCWAHHAVAHVMEMQGRPEDGLGWMAAREAFWSGEDNTFKVHNWWHRALFYLDLDQADQALALYDGAVRADRSSFVLDLIDASALLWRLQLCGIDVGDRWQELAGCWDRHIDGAEFAFNDWHALMAYLGAGRERDVVRLLEDYRSGAAKNTESARWATEFGLPLIEGFAAFWRHDYATACDRLHRVRHIANAFGGSHAQRDVIDWTLTEAAIRGGDRTLARGLVNERKALKPHGHVIRQFESRLAAPRAGRQAA